MSDTEDRSGKPPEQAPEVVHLNKLEHAGEPIAFQAPSTTRSGIKSQWDVRRRSDGPRPWMTSSQPPERDPMSRRHSTHLFIALASCGYSAPEDMKPPRRHRWSR